MVEPYLLGHLIQWGERFMRLLISHPFSHSSEIVPGFFRACVSHVAVSVERSFYRK